MIDKIKRDELIILMVNYYKDWKKDKFQPQSDMIELIFKENDFDEVSFIAGLILGEIIYK